MGLRASINYTVFILQIRCQIVNDTIITHVQVILRNGVIAFCRVPIDCSRLGECCSSVLL